MNKQATTGLFLIVIKIMYLNKLIIIKHIERCIFLLAFKYKLRDNYFKGGSYEKFRFK